MIVETIVIKSRVTGLEIVAHYSDEYDYRLNIGESCYSVAVQHDGVEYVVCVDKSYDSAQETAEYLTRKLGFPLVVNRVTRLRNNKYNIVRDNVCIEAYSKSIQNSSTDKYIIGDLDDDLYEIDFDLTTRNWSSQKDDDE